MIFCQNATGWAAPSLLRAGILKSHDNGQSGGSFGGCVRCGFVVSAFSQQFRYSPSPLKIEATYKKTEKKLKKHDFYRIFVRAITL